MMEFVPEMMDVLLEKMDFILNRMDYVLNESKKSCSASGWRQRLNSKKMGGREGAHL